MAETLTTNYASLKMAEKMFESLTKNAISMMCNWEFLGDDVKLVVQVANFRVLVEGQQKGQQKGDERYQMLLSDGIYFVRVLLGFQMNYLVLSGKLHNGSIVQLTKFNSQIEWNEKLFTIIELTVLLENCDQIGEPDIFVQRGDASARQAQPSIYSHPLQPTYQQPAPMYVYRGPKNVGPAIVIPIAALSPFQDWWTIKARVTSKKDLRCYNNPLGEGTVFSFDLLDSDGGEIQVTCFNAVADEFYNWIEAGKVYFISRGVLKLASKIFNRFQNEYEIYLEKTSIVQPCVEDDSTIPRQKFHFRPISDLKSMETNAIVDVLGVVSSINLTASITKKDGTKTLKRTLQLKDMSGRSVELTLWGNVCNAEGQQLQNMFDSGLFPVLAVKAGRVIEFNGRSVRTHSTSQLFIEPDFPEAHRLKKWFDMEGKNTPAISISKEASGTRRVDVRKTVSQIKDERLGTSEEPDWIIVKATISIFNAHNFCYTACTLTVGDRKCREKVTKNGYGQWRCARCDQSVGECEYRYILHFRIQDFTGDTWVYAFQEMGEEIMGISAKELYYLKDKEIDTFLKIIRRVFCTQYIFKLKVKEEMFGDEQRVMSTVVRAEKLNFSFESRFLLDKLAVEDPSANSVTARDCPGTNSVSLIAKLKNLANVQYIWNLTKNYLIRTTS